jgi:hypothetical protein
MICCTLCGEDVELGGGRHRYTDACRACMENLPDAEEYYEAEMQRRREESDRLTRPASAEKGDDAR